MPPQESGSVSFPIKKSHLIGRVPFDHPSFSLNLAALVLSVEQVMATSVEESVVGLVLDVLRNISLVPFLTKWNHK